MKTQESQQWFETAMEENKKILFKICNSYCRNRDDRDDLAQEIVVHLWRAFEGFDGRCKFSTWMYRIALNVAISFYRREATRTRFVVSSDEQVLEAVDLGGQQPEELRILYELIERLDLLNKALMLLYLDGNSYGEMADVLGISETNVATKISRLKTEMRNTYGTR